MDRLGVPQLAIIDKKGVIRVQSEPLGASGEMQSEPFLTKTINELLAEGSGKSAAKPAPTAPKSAPDAAKKSE